MRILFYILLFTFFSINAQAQIVINEISYNPPEAGTDSLEYIELYNAGNSHVDLTGWYFTSGVVDTFPSVHMQPGDYFVTAVNAGAMMSVFNINVLQWTMGALNNGGELIVLVDAGGNFIDSVAYGETDPWPTDSDGMGPSLELRDALLDNSDGANWQASGNGTGVIINGNEVLGTPGQENSSGGTGGGPAVTIDVAHLEFSPKHAVVQMGDTVRWVNNEAVPHNVNGLQSVYPNNPDNFFSGAPVPGPWQYDYEFINAGLNDYHCNVHVSMGMRGTVAVYNPDGSTVFPLPHLRLTDGVNGQHIFDGVSTTVTGVVHGINFQPSGYSFYIINENNVGINVFSFDPGTYIVTEGDELQIRGVIDQFNGLLEIVPDEITVLSTNNPLTSPDNVVDLSEEVEGSHVVLSNYSIDSIVVTGVSGYNVYVTQALGAKVLIRVDADTGIDEFEIAASDGVRGIGSQFDGTFPYTSGYQLQALQFFILPGFPTLDQDAISMSPNPASSSLNLESDYNLSAIEIYSIDGKLLLAETVNSQITSLNISSLYEALYVVKVITNEGIWTSLSSVVK